MFRRSIRVELRAVVGGLCTGPAKASHRIQRFELRQLKQGLCELVDLLCQFWYSTFFAAVMPSRPPSPAIVVGTGVDQLADRMLQVIKRKLLFGAIIFVFGKAELTDLPSLPAPFRNDMLFSNQGNRNNQVLLVKGSQPVGHAQHRTGPPLQGGTCQSAQTPLSAFSAAPPSS